MSLETLTWKQYTHLFTQKLSDLTSDYGQIQHQCCYQMLHLIKSKQLQSWLVPTGGRYIRWKHFPLLFLREIQQLPK